MAPKVRFEIMGDGELKNKVVQESITLDGDSSLKISDLIDTDSEITIPTSKIGTISKIIVIATDANLIIETSAPSTITLPIKGLLYYDVQETFAGTITDVKISTDSTEAVDVDVVVFGEETV